MPRAPLLALPLAAVLLAGCGTDPAAERRAAVAEVTQAANAGDADGVRTHAEALLATVAAQLERDELAADEAERLTALAEAVHAGADVIDEDLLQQRQAEAARKALEEARKALEEERRRAEEAAREAEEEAKDEEGKDKGGKDD